MSKNAIGIDLPEQVGSYHVRPYSGPENPPVYEGPVVTQRRVGYTTDDTIKLQPSLEAAILASGLQDGMTISFHHSFREGDFVVGQVLAAIRKLGIKNLRFAPSAVVNLRNFSLAEYVKDGTITRVEASGIRGELGDGLINGTIVMDEPVILRPHGARPRAIEAGELTIDVAFIAASAAFSSPSPPKSGSESRRVSPSAIPSKAFSVRESSALASISGNRSTAAKITATIPNDMSAETR